ncbi:MAG: hypothetical protein AAF125_14165 [Chloroflexota bacterium]
MQQPPTPLEPIEIHYYYACSWVINHHGINQFPDLAEIAASMNVGLGVRRMFTDQHGFVMYPFTIKVPDENTLKAFLKRVAAGLGMEEWYIVNVSYYEKAVPFAENLEKVLGQMPKWEEHIRAYADHNAKLHEQLKTQTPGEGETDGTEDQT